MSWSHNYMQEHTYTLLLPTQGIEDSVLRWTQENCQHEWGWGWGDEARPYVTFTDGGDAMLWKLRWWQHHQDMAKLKIIDDGGADFRYSC